ncbi:MAG: O-antigen ligase family protein [Alcanivoracaceae bacterium]|nr:O-antigen ligase family protein [Alcanivoracaceae bacterium]
MKNHSSRRNLSSNKRQKIFFLIYCFILLINPFPLGSNRVWAWSFEAMTVVGLLLLMVLCSLVSNQCLSWRRIKKMKPELFLIGAWLFVNVLYLIPVPLSFLSIISPTVANAYANLNLDYGYLSLDVYASYQTLMLSLYYFILFIIGVILINSRKRIKFVLTLFLLLGVFESIYGMYLVSIGQTGTLVQITTVSNNNASGTFINKNHLVAFLSMCFILGLALRLILSRNSPEISHIDRKVRIIRFISQPVRLLDFSLFLIIAGIWNTHSRAGLASFILALMFLYLLIFINKKMKSIKMKTIIFVFVLGTGLLIVVADDVSYLLNVLGQNSEDSMEHILNSAQGRILAVNQVLDNYHKYWFSGVGPGAYPIFFVNHRLLEQTAYFDHAHNDYIEFIIEYGVFSIILLVLLLLFLYRIFVFVFKTDSSFYKIIGIGSVSCMIYMLLHGNMDFNARIPANVVTIIVAISVVYGKVIMSGVNIKPRIL